MGSRTGVRERDRERNPRESPRSSPYNRAEGAIVRLQVTKTQLHRYLKWLWVALIPVSFAWRAFLPWIVFMSHYAIIAGHWGAEEAADDSLVTDDGS